MFKNQHINQIKKRNDVIIHQFLDDDELYLALVKKYKNSDGFINYSSASDMQTQSLVMEMSPHNISTHLTDSSSYPGFATLGFDLEVNVRDFFKQSFDINLNLEQIMIFNGVYGAYKTILSASPCKAIICPEIMYQHQKACFISINKEVIEVRVTDSGLIDIDHLEQLLKSNTNDVGFIYINHNIGSFLTKEYFEKLAELLEQYDVFALYDADVMATSHDGISDPLLPLKVTAFAQRSIVLCNMSKELGSAGLRIGFGIGPAELIYEVKRYQQMSLEIIPTPSRELAKILLKKADLSQASAVFKERMEQLCKELSLRGWNLQPPAIGINLFTPVPKAFASIDYASPGLVFSYYLMRYLQVRVRPGSIHGKRLNSFVRFVIAPTLQQAQEVFKRFDKHNIHFDMQLPDGLKEEYLQLIDEVNTHHTFR